MLLFVKMEAEKKYIAYMLSVKGFEHMLSNPKNLSRFIHKEPFYTKITGSFARLHVS